MPTDLLLQESEYRMKCLVRSKELYHGKGIALYGTGDNARTILEALKDENIIGLIDGNHTGEYFYNKFVLPLEEVGNAGIEVIIIAAIVSSSIYVEKRIINFCIERGIALIDMYGCDLIERRKNLLDQEINYCSMNAEKVVEKIKSNDMICVEADSCVCENNDGELVIRKRVIEQIKTALELGKKIYILRNDNIGANELAEAVDIFLNKDSYTIIPNNDTIGLSDGALRLGLEESFGRKTLYLGTEYNASMALAYAYKMDVILLKSIWSMIKDVSTVHLSRNVIEENCDRQFIKAVCSNYSSPFPNDINREGFGSMIRTPETGSRNTVLVVSFLIPRIDCDSGSKTIYQYIKLFRKKGYKVVLLPMDFARNKYADVFEDMGVEILAGEEYRASYPEWILKHSNEISFSFVAYPEVAFKIKELLSFCNIRTLYYGLDLHFRRKQREYKLSGNEYHKAESDRYREMEETVIKDVYASYFPSEEEVDIVKREFDLDSHYLTVLFYGESYQDKYDPLERKGIMYVGGYRLAPNVDAVEWFLRDVFPMVWEQSQIPFYIVGADEPQHLKEIVHPGVIHVGHVTDDELEDLYRKIKMVVIPIRYGAGVKGKVVDALYRGVPMVSTSIGIEGIPDAENIVKHDDTAIGFAQKVVSLYSDDDLLKEVSLKYKDLAMKYYSEEAAWNSLMKPFSENI